MCANMCTDWAKSYGKKQCCCHLNENTSPGTMWVCAIHDAYSMISPPTADYFAGRGQCQ